LFDPADKKHLIPQTDDVLKEKLKKNSEDIVKSSTYYEAVGRVIAYCIGQKLPLASHILV
jgi:hypothetical protein